ncbi:CbiX/SirB N-terminal domain-containing protein [Pseudovibrio sp. Tun.PSC04-5.I4]|uniref:CbiX/SirB N-terminal domain-containing protein n=1 Tax=Pseudovibrio sp. Tun.PSC04-5.I4 TaxID=1798213 RepID=UPI00088DCB74|nr:CbiX/SirB N-terminal domain-containing protein [Pseudovibrio sp. Tun.PSC04-5.I4]SDR48480.1 sirohydrochlorin cobaltochelatase [Pseudovibrio sp. Tun.PSC04-5.I4]
MSGTRSPSLQAPATESVALVLAAHGDLGGKGANTTPGHERLKQALAPLLPDMTVVSGVMKGSPPLEDVAAGLRHSNVLVLPLLLSNGYFCNTVLPKRLGLNADHKKQKEGEWRSHTREGQSIRLLPPLGVLPFLPELVLESIQDTLETDGRNSSAPQETEILLVAHGSTVGPQSRICALQLKDELEKRSSYNNIHCAFLSEAPLVDDVISTLSPNSIVVPLFASGGLHGHDDIAGFMKCAPTGCRLAPVIGCEHSLAQHLAIYLQNLNS